MCCFLVDMGLEYCRSVECGRYVECWKNVQLQSYRMLLVCYRNVDWCWGGECCRRKLKCCIAVECYRNVECCKNGECCGCIECYGSVLVFQGVWMLQDVENSKVTVGAGRCLHYRSGSGGRQLAVGQNKRYYMNLILFYLGSTWLFSKQDTQL